MKFSEAQETVPVVVPGMQDDPPTRGHRRRWCWCPDCCCCGPMCCCLIICIVVIFVAVMVVGGLHLVARAENARAAAETTRLTPMGGGEAGRSLDFAVPTVSTVGQESGVDRAELEAIRKRLRDGRQRLYQNPTPTPGYG